MDSKDLVISVTHLYKKFGDFIANDDLNFDVYKGEIFGFLGANGAGKTTAIKILCGLSLPTSGDLKVGGYDVYTQTELIKKNIGYMSQRFSLYNDLTVFENIRFFAGIYGMRMKQIREKSDYLIEKTGLQKERNVLVASLPLGWKQKLAFSIAIIHNPKAILGHDL
jgi:ABC-2 type transport system ATP-binding protein